MILAAGLGSRLQPVTSFIPKPLLPLPHGETLLGTMIHYLQTFGFESFAVNSHYLGNQVETAVKQQLGKNGYLFPETELLGTGGPLVNARMILEKGDFFLLYNADILCDANFTAMAEYHRLSGNLATLGLIEGPENRVLLEGKRIVDLRGVLGVPTENRICRTYAGFAFFSPKIFNYLPEKAVTTDIIETLLTAIRAGEKIGGYLLPSNTYWSDLGTVQKYLLTAQDYPEKLKNKSKCSTQTGLERIAEQGSARQFYRLKVNEQSRILMCSTPDDPDFMRFIDFGHFLYKHNCGTPQIFGYSDFDRTVLMEDLGKTMLYDAVQGLSVEEVGDLYSMTVDALVHFQNLASENHPETLQGFRYFDWDYLRWESRYFEENLLPYAEIKMNSEKLLELRTDFDRLATLADQQPKVWMHRDFQSQNIMIQDKKIRLVDFQGARLGPYAYDLLSLILDPYLEIPESAKNQAKKNYFEKIRLLPALAKLTWEQFESDCRIAGLQRILQALGAYAFLSEKKKKRRYSKFIPPALKRLHSLLEDENRFPALRHLVTQLSSFLK